MNCPLFSIICLIKMLMFILILQVTSCNKLHLPKGKTTALQNSVRYNGVIIWNSICDKVYYDCNIILFKKRVKQYLITNPE